MDQTYKLGMLLGVGLCWLWASCAWAQDDAQCSRLFQQGEVQKAGVCFEALARGLGPAKALSEERRFQKGRWVRNAAVLFRRFAAKQSSQEQAGVLRERALQLLKLYQKENLCETSEQCRQVETLYSIIEQEIGYTLLAITTGLPQSQLNVSGYRSQWKLTGDQFRRKVRPGIYIITVKYPKNPTQTRKVTVVQGKPRLVEFRPPTMTVPVRVKIVQVRVPEKTRVHRTPWIVVGVGGGLAVLGGVLALLGGTQNIRLFREVRSVDEPSKGRFAADIMADFQTADTLFAVGMVGLGVGIATVVAGSIWAARVPRVPVEPAQKGSKRSSGALVLPWMRW